MRAERDIPMAESQVMHQQLNDTLHSRRRPVAEADALFHENHIKDDLVDRVHGTSLFVTDMLATLLANHKQARHMQYSEEFKASTIMIYKAVMRKMNQRLHEDSINRLKVNISEAITHGIDNVDDLNAWLSRDDDEPVRGILESKQGREDESLTIAHNTNTTSTAPFQQTAFEDLQDQVGCYTSGNSALDVQKTAKAAKAAKVGNNTTNSLVRSEDRRTNVGTTLEGLRVAGTGTWQNEQPVSWSSPMARFKTIRENVRAAAAGHRSSHSSNIALFSSFEMANAPVHCHGNTNDTHMHRTNEATQLAMTSAAMTGAQEVVDDAQGDLEMRDLQDTLVSPSRAAADANLSTLDRLRRNLPFGRGKR